jgi:hypothetical protein
MWQTTQLRCVRNVALHLGYSTCFWLSVSNLPLKCAVVSMYSVVNQRLKCYTVKVCNCLIQFLLTLWFVDITSNTFYKCTATFWTHCTRIRVPHGKLAVAVLTKKLLAVSRCENSLPNALHQATGPETGWNKISSYPHTLFLQHLLRQQPAVYVYFSQVIFCFHVDLLEAERKSNFDKYILGRSRWPRCLRRRFAAAR